MARARPPMSGAVLFYWLANPDGGVLDWALSRLPHWLGGGPHWAGYNWTTTGAFQAYLIIAVLVVWQSFPFIAVTVLAGLKTIPEELHEAARVDGASPWRRVLAYHLSLVKAYVLWLFLLSVDLGLTRFAERFLL